MCAQLSSLSQALNGRPVYHFTQDGQDLIGYMGSLTTPDYNEQVRYHNDT